MKNAIPRTHAAMQNRPTAYEVKAERADGTTVVLGYTSRKTRLGLLNVAQERHEDVLSMAGDSDVDTYSKARGFQIGHVRIFFSGTTERTARSTLNGV